MALVVGGSENRRYADLIKSEQDDSVVGSFVEKVSTISRTGSLIGSPKIAMEQEKRMRREIANSNERRRMQSINAGFQSLRGLLPHHEGEKLSKAAILQQTAEYIYQLEQDKSKLLNQNAQLKRLVTSQTSASCDGAGTIYSSPQSPAIDIPPTVVKRRKTIDGAVESADEGIGNMSPEHSGSGEDSRSEVNELKRETIDLRIQLERERRHRIGLEEHINIMQQHQSQIYPRKLENESIQTVEEVESFQRVPTPQRDEAPRCYTIRNNLETIVEAIRHLEGDHLFSDERNHNSSPSSTPKLNSRSSSPRVMEMDSSYISVESSPTHSQSMLEMVPLALTSASLSSLGRQNSLQSGSTFPSSMSSTPVSTTVTSLKHHVLNRLRTSGTDEPINLEFRPVLSRSPSPTFQRQQQSLPIQFHIQQQRPGVIVEIK